MISVCIAALNQSENCHSDTQIYGSNAKRHENTIFYEMPENKIGEES